MTIKIAGKKIRITSELLFNLQKEQMNFLPWQSRWYQTRFLKSCSLQKGRQVGADYYFLFEALQDACLTGRNKIFIGSVPVNYLLKHAMIKKHEEAHNYIFKLSNGASIYILNPDHLNEITLGGISGDVYISEWSWINNLHDVIQLASAFSMHKKWRVTLYTFRSLNDPRSYLNNAYLYEALLGKDYYQDTVQNSEYEIGSLFSVNKETITDWELVFGEVTAKEMIFCCFNDN